MNDSPLISVIIPCYQSGRSLRRTLDGIFAQTYRNIEVIAVDDGSTDTTSEVLSSYTKPMTVVRQENKGAAAARNHGFRISRGQFVFFCDDDVDLDPRILEKMLQKLLQTPQAAYCYSSFRFGFHTFDHIPFDAEKLKRENYISTMSLLRRESFIGFDESLSRYQDWDLWKRMLDQGMSGVWIPERLFSAPMSRGGISSYSIKSIAVIIKRRLGWKP